MTISFFQQDADITLKFASDNHADRARGQVSRPWMVIASKKVNCLADACPIERNRVPANQTIGVKLSKAKKAIPDKTSASRRRKSGSDGPQWVSLADKITDLCLVQGCEIHLKWQSTVRPALGGPGYNVWASLTSHALQPKSFKSVSEDISRVDILWCKWNSHKKSG